MKLRINTINGGGKQTLVRLVNSIKPLISELNKHDWSWTILSQGSSGADIATLRNLKTQISNINFLHYPRNLGTVWATNELIDYTKQDDFDIFFMVDDDIEFKKTNFIDEMASTIIKGERKTVCDLECIFGLDRNKLNQQGRFVEIKDHGSGCTMYSKDVYETNTGPGYHDENLIQYAHDTEFNIRIKLAFGDTCLSVFTEGICNHYNQTGTKLNFNSTLPFAEVIRRDNNYLGNKKHDPAFPWLGRTFFKQPLFTSSCVLKQ